MNGDMHDLFYALVRNCFWALPAPLRNQLHGVRHSLARWMRTRRRPRKVVQRPGDLGWPEFSDAVWHKITYRAVIILEPSLDWEIFLFQRPHHIALALGCLGCLVIFKTTGDGVAGFRQVAVNVWIANDQNVNAIHDAVRVFFSTSLLADAEDILGASEHGRVIYDYIDHIDPSISGGKVSLKRLERLKRAAFDGAADIIVSSASTLHREAIAQCGEERCVLIPNGVDVQHYQNARGMDVNLPRRLTAFREKHRRIVGYFGAIAPWLWYEVMAEVSALMKDVGFIFIGPDYSGCVPRLPQNDNTLYVGAVNYSVLPAYARLFDVCFIPFRPGEVAHSTSPLKLYEYFALEKPVVVTADMNECINFQEVFSGNDAIELVEAIDRAFAVCNNQSYRARLRALAEANDWSDRATAYLTKLDRLDDK